MVLYLCSSAPCTLRLIGPLLNIKFSGLMSSLSSSICFFSLCFNGSSFRAPFVLPFFTPNDLPTTNAAALIGLFVSKMSLVVNSKRHLAPELSASLFVGLAYASCMVLYYSPVQISVSSARLMYSSSSPYPCAFLIR